MRRLCFLFLVFAAAMAAAEDGAWTRLDVRNADFSHPGGDGRTLYVFAADHWERSPNSGVMQLDQGLWAAFANRDRDGDRNGLLQIVDGAVVPGEYRLSVRSSCFVPNLRSRVELGHTSGDRFEVLAAHEVVPSVLQRRQPQPERWTLQQVSVSVPESSPAVGERFYIRLTGLVDAGADRTYGDQFYLWDDVALEGRTEGTAASTQPRPEPGTRDAGHPGPAALLVGTAEGIVLLERQSQTVVRRLAVGRINSLEILDNGNLLISYSKEIREIDTEGKIVRSLRGEAFELITDAKAVDASTILVSDGQAGQVSEVDWNGNVRWSIEGLHWPSESTRLPDGNTLVADGTNVLKEFDRNGSLVRSHRLAGWAVSAKRLPDGSTLVGERCNVELVDAKGASTWQLPARGRIADVRLLSNGLFLATDSDECTILLLTPAGELVWKLDVAAFTSTGSSLSAALEWKLPY